MGIPPPNVGGYPYPCVCVWTYLRSQSCCYGPRVYHASSTAKRKTKRQGQNAIAHACGRVCRWWDTYITPQSCQDCYRVYHASSTAKTRAKRHCACVWMDLQMVGHIYHTTIVSRLLSCISRFIHGKNKGKTPLRMRVDGFEDGGTHISHHNRVKTAIVYITLRSMQKQRQNAIAHACGRVCRWWDTYITPQSCQDCYRVYHASFNAKTRTKRHCACVWTGLQMVGHVYHTTIVLIVLSCILRFIRGKNKDKTPLRMRVDGFADGGTHISNHNRAKTAIVYITLHPRQKQGQNAIAHACGRFADGGTRISNHNHANRAIMYITLHPRQKQRQNAIAHACGRFCRWWDTYLQPHSYFVLHVFVSFPRKPLFVCLTFRESFNFLYILTIVLHDWILDWS